jgi:phosphoribosyl 1,2-cyclic phosphate phosphodiesterase
MFITFLGTSAANSYPEAFCRCANCEEARALGGPSLRKRSSALINEDLLIDYGPDVLAASMLHRCPLTHVQYCLQTHSHADHLDTSHFLSRSPEYEVIGAPRLHFYASAGSLQDAAQRLRDFSPASLLDPPIGDRLNLTIHPVEALQSFPVGPYQVTAFPANHDPSVDSLLYAIEADGRTIFYGTDTASLLPETWQAFHRAKLHFDLVILDHTYGPDEPGTDHLSARQVIEHIARMREEGLLKPSGRALATHISHPGNPVHPKLVEFAAQHGYEVAYDGLRVDVT